MPDQVADPMSEYRFSIESIRLYERMVTFRMPFRYGIVTLTAAPEALVSARIRSLDGSVHTGVAADLMAPKWFDKNPDLTNQQNFEQLRQALALARARYLGERGTNTAFGHHAAHMRDHQASCAQAGLNPLVAGFGSALVDRAILDACCRGSAMSFFDAIGSNLPGITAQTAPDLAGFDLAGFLKSLKPGRHIDVRHTVGLSDAVTDAAIGQDAPIADGLPRSLEANCAAYGLRAFKLKAGGDIDADLDRLQEIASVLDRLSTPYICTLDGNEQYADPEAFLALWSRIGERPHLARLKSSIAFVEQPIARDRALTEKLGETGHCIAMEIDESDGDIDAFPKARSLGYSGVSSKSCKGVYRSLLNRARVEMWNRECGESRYFMSAEDLSTQAGTALQQDLSLASLIGCTHVERNGHHYGDGLSGAAPQWRETLAADHPDLYCLSGDRVNVIIRDGSVSLRSLDCTGYGTRTLPPAEIFTPSDP